MRSIASKLFKRVSITAISVVLSVSSLSAAMPLFLSQAAHASPANVVTDTNTNATYTSIQAAVSAANPGDTIEVGAGTYTEAVTINTPVSIVGDAGAILGVNTTTVNGITINANNVSISGLTITGPAAGVSYSSFPWGGDITRGIVVTQNVTGFNLSNNTLTSLRNDLLIDGRNNTGSVTSNTIDNSKSGISVQYTDATGITISGNTQGVFRNDWGVNLHLNGHYSNGVTDGNNADKIANIAPLAVQDAILANSSANNGWTVQDQGYALSNRTAVTVATNGASSTAQGDPLGPISTIQGGLNAVTKNGIVNVKNGTYTEGSSNPASGLTFTNPGTHLVGQSETGTIIVPVSNQYGYGLTSESVGDVSISNLTVNGTSTSGGAALKFHNFSGLTLNNIDVTGVNTPHSTGIDINSVSNVALNNVNVTGFGKNGIAVTAQYAGTDVLTQNVAFSNVTSNNNSWAGLAFYNSNNSGSVADNINGVTFTGANQLEHNGEGLFVEGGTDANHNAHNTPLYTITGVGNTPVNLGNTTFSGNFLDIDNYQTNNLNALSAIFGTKTGNQMYASEQATQNGLIVDQRDHATFGLVNYYDTTAVIAAPTDARWLSHQGDVLGAFTNVNLVTPAWTAPTSGTVDHYEYSYTSPTTGWSAPETLTAATSIPDQSFYGAGNNGTEGAWQFEVRAVSSTGDVSDWTQSPVLTYDKTAPAIPNNLSWLDSNNQSAHNGFTNVQKGTLSWKDSTPTDVDHYVYKFWTNISGYFDGENNAWTTSGSQYITKSSTGGSIWTDFANKQGTYYFCIEAVDAAGNTSDCSNTLSITYDNTAPTGLANLSPLDGAYVTTAAQTSIDWTDASDSSELISYYYESSNSSSVNSDGSFVSPVYQSGALSTSAIPTPNTPEGIYYWHVRAVDAAGNSTAWTTPWKITVDNTAPAAPVVTATGITSGQSTKQGSVNILWTQPSTDTVKYDYKVWTDIAGDAYNGESHAYFANDLTANSRLGAFTEGQGTYFVQVHAIDAAGNTSPWSDTFSVVYDTTPPSVSIPTYGTVGNVITPNVTATDQNSPLIYAWTTTVSDSDVSISSATAKEPTFTVHNDGTYSFTLTATDPAGNATPSTFTFTYVTPTTPIAPVVNAPANATPTNNGTGFTNVTTTPAADQGVLGATTTNNNSSTGDTAVKGATDTKNVAAAATTTKGNIFGIAWYWWLLILAAIAVIWAILAARRRRNQES